MRYRWSAIDQEGEVVCGVAAAPAKIMLHYQLRMRQLLPIAIERSELPILGSKERKRLLEQLAMLLGANMPLLQVLEFMAEDSVVRRGKQLLQLAVQRVLQDGCALSVVLKELNIVDAVQFQLVHAGESGGQLNGVLRQLVGELNAEEARRKRMKKILNYPAMLLVITILVVTVFLQVILPQFAELFGSMQLELPAVTLVILRLAHFAGRYGVAVGAGIGASVLIAIACYRLSGGLRYWLDRWLLQVPGLGRVIVYRCSQRLFTMLALLLSSGTHLVPALALLKELLANTSYRRAIMQVREDLIGGLEFHQALRNTELFEASALQFVMLGERSGQLSEIAAQLGRYYDTKLAEWLDRLGQRLEPALILLLGCVIGTLVLGMYLPIFRLGEVVH